ncbi:PIN domain-containing protein [Actinokineospora pegani]|uniref:hypothetical protein n=1 Tax=Actinokineospora pegani TaxID=2654637 RepID=UPI001F39A2A6|nr:hypothetical protein [Actinokineospora pegani]
MIYLDSCAVVKLIHSEAHSRDLVEWLNQDSLLAGPLVSSVLVEIEVRPRTEA